MSSIHDMISAFIAMLMSAAFLHFGATGDSRPVKPVAEAAHASIAPQPVVETASTTTTHTSTHRLTAHSHCHGSAGAMPSMDAVRATSPLRRG